MDLDKILSFKIKGAAAHFKKYYSNKTSLTYLVPPRTVLMGMIGSILEYPRDSYYEKLGIERAKFGLKLQTPVYKHQECRNYLKAGGGRTQVRLELLFPQDKEQIEYTIFFTHTDLELIDQLAEKISKSHLGYGIFLGQSQFRASAGDLEIFDRIEIRENYSGNLESLTYKNNIIEVDSENKVNLRIDNMPVDFKSVSSGREPTEVNSFCFSEDGTGIKGKFEKVFLLEEQAISFYTPIKLGGEN